MNSTKSPILVGCVVYVILTKLYLITPLLKELETVLVENKGLRLKMFEARFQIWIG